jgi:hypothetical protein
MKLTGGPHMAVTWEREGDSTGMCKVKGNTPKLLGPNGLSGDPAAYGVKRASTGGAGLDGPKSGEISFSNKK